MTLSLTAIVPAAGVGSRMAADRPKQYLEIAGKTILEHTVDRLFSHPSIGRIVIAISAGDPYFPTLPLASDPRITVVDGGAERADSVFSALAVVDDNDWVLVHDAARPCVRTSDLSQLIDAALLSESGAILAAPVRDTMKRGAASDSEHGTICSTVDRNNLWHALTPQMFKAAQLKAALTYALEQGATITDEASALEFCGYAPLLVKGRADNLKVTQPEDLALAGFYLEQLIKELP
ncbi:2-C-methyl-D-erythritol 4-phosphate cytidylyltransferase [Photobacterium damselae]|uniref:2-C-methyl-D-erythritol 4-phosphate cytidylyltransferase n=1 Tax=Photobacterium damselae TaxID=38293 RepID=UPI00083B250D|nr:2-C-methyl-D-erythritol 4-phosphate cytidylyltransferase [Photobacterium damselae]KAB1509523.1 2-C-methyl-D-erythritol 4-phosphate cytidylyltransferase [Photobacterium damselae subsp. damselae]ODA25322.1 2-C-methyl-D-erythritol 4-phosphate cytidylyltransferase [Photobacterium damselae subsp. damselae]TLS66589.1 2-C-methyl-D-erythritol 4-phosphate cytidylyltransferase [Photobacterium damselae subsp. damselae]